MQAWQTKTVAEEEVEAEMEDCMIGDDHGDCDDDGAGCAVVVGAHVDDVVACWTSLSRRYCADRGEKTL